MPKVPFSLLLSLCLTILPGSIWAATELKFEVHPPIESGTPPYELSVHLSPKLILTDASGTRVARDFASARLVETDSSGGSTRDDSLFSVVAQRAAEFENQKMISTVLSRVGKESTAPPLAMLGHIYSMDSGSSPQVSRSTTERGVKFTHEGKCLAEYTKDGLPATPETVSQFVMFLRYEYGLHPKVLSELQSLDYVPSEIVIGLPASSESLYKLTLKSKKDSSPPILAPPGPPPSDRLYDLAAKASSMTSEERQSLTNGILDKAASHAEAGRNLEAISLLSAYAVSTGKTPPSLAALRERLADDDKVRILLGAISPADEPAAKKALADLEALEESAADGKSMLKVFRANITAALGSPALAIDLFLQALTMDPSLAGAWFDLGAAYHAGFDTRSAWKCYDTGRRIAPEHPACAEVDSLEDEIRRDHPDFFL